jgi:hypothetical protein
LRADGPVDFERDVAPILTRRCVICHNPDDRKGGFDLTQRQAALAGGDSGAVIVPGRSTDSLLWQYVSSGEMPPKKPLTERDRAILRQWLDAGAPWTGGALDPLRFSSDVRAGYDWWSLQPVKATRLPTLAEDSWAVQPIDYFVLAKLREHSLQPSQEAPRRVAPPLF